LPRDHAQYRVVELAPDALQILLDPGMHVHGVNVVLKCRLPERELRWSNNSRSSNPGAPCTKPPAGPPGVGSVAPRPPAHPSRAGGRGRQSLPGGTSVRSAFRVTPLCHAPSVDFTFHRYTRQVILALPRIGSPGAPRVRREVAHA
jgi:hypothetical protein